MLLGEWACLGILAEAPAHGFAVAARLKPDGDIGRVWELSRALTYRALSQLLAAGLVAEVGTERGIAGGTRTVLQPTRDGAKTLRKWLVQPVPHLRDLRSELLLKLVLGERLGIDQSAMLQAQQSQYIQDKFAKLDQSLYNQSVYYEPNRLAAYYDYESMEFTPEVSAALDIYAEESTTMSEKG